MTPAPEETPAAKPANVTLMVAVAGLFVLLIAARVVIVEFLLTPEWINANVVPMIEETIGRDVEFDEINLGLRGLSLKGLSVSEDAAFHRDEMTQFASLDELILRVKFLPLLRLRLEMSEVVIADPLIVVHRNAAGRFNFSSLPFLGSPDETAGAPATEEAGQPSAPAKPASEPSGHAASKHGADDEHAADEPESEPAEATGITVLPHRVSIRNARVVFIDEAAADTGAEGGLLNRVELRFFNLAAEGVSLEDPFEVASSFELELSGAPTTHFEIGAQFEPAAPFIGFEIDINEIDVDRLVALAAVAGTGGGESEPSDSGSPLGDYLVQAQLSVGAIRTSGLEFTDFTLDASFLDNKLSVNSMATTFAEGQINAEAEIDLGGETFAYSAGGSVSGVKLQALPASIDVSPATDLQGDVGLLFEASGTGVPDATLWASGKLGKGEEFLVKAMTLSRASFGFDLRGDGSEAGTVRVGSLEVSIPKFKPDEDAPYSVTAAVTLPEDRPSKLEANGLIDLPDATLRADLNLDRLDLDRALAAMSTPEPAPTVGPGEAQAAEIADPAPIAPLAISARIDIDEVLTGGFTATEFHAQTVLDEKKAELRTLTLAIGGGMVEAAGHVDLTNVELPYKGQLEVRDTDVEQLTAPFWDESWGALTGKLEFDASVQGSAADTERIAENMRGGGKLTLDGGSFTGSPVLRALATVAQVPAIADLDLVASGGAFTIADGKVSTQRMLLGDPKRRVVFVGDVGMDGALALEARIGTAPGEPSPLGGAAGAIAPFLLESSDGWSELPLAVGGTMDAPRPALPTRSLTEKAGQLVPKLLNSLLGGEKPAAETGTEGDAPEEPAGTEDAIPGQVGDVLRGLNDLFQ